MTFEPALQLFDCPTGHRATTDPDRWQTAKMYMLVADIEAFLNPVDRLIEHEHRWVMIEQPPHESLHECLLCSNWRLGPPLAQADHDFRA
jgi:hypothetical protein